LELSVYEMLPGQIGSSVYSVVHAKDVVVRIVVSIMIINR